MPSATPIPGGPSALLLGSAMGLLTRPGCPVCRYAAEAGDRYLAWFALEGHADPVTVTRLCASLGACARHTRALMGQPGAATRLTAVYRYLLQAARAQLAGRGSRLAACPACEHDEAAAGRALEALLDGLPETGVGERYLELGGLCWPHVLTAAGARGHRRAAAWVVQATAARTGDHRTSLGVLAGGPDHDADERARLRAGLPAEGRIPPGACQICLAAARAELGVLAWAAGAGRRPDDGAGNVPRGGICLCAGHLRDAVLMGGGRAPALLVWQADNLADGLDQLARSLARRGGSPGRWLRGRRSASLEDGCPACLARGRAVGGELQRCRAVPPGAGQPPCVRHVLALRAADPATGLMAAGPAVRRADGLLGELAEAFRKGTWAFRHESRGLEMSAWRRAVAFIDGGVFGGCPPEQR
jgi:hypothetical protein